MTRSALLAAAAVLAAGCESGERPAPTTSGDLPAASRRDTGWRELDVPAVAGSGQAHLAAGPDGGIVLSWLEPATEGTALKLGALENGAFGAPRTVVSGDNLLVSWADFPSILPITADLWAAHWLRSVPGSVGAYDIVFALSTDGGTTFGEGALLNLDGTLSEHGFVSWFPWDEDIGVVWLDGSRMAALFESGDFDPEGPPVGTSLRFARIRADGTRIADGEVDELACDCCRTAAAAASGGPVVAYRDRTEEEIRDIVVRRFVGGEWSAPVVLGPDGWRIEGCPVNGPAMAADGAEVVVAWFTAAHGVPRVRLARSADVGASFGAPVDIDSGDAFGQVGVALLDDGDAAVSWWRKGPAGGIELAVRRVARDGALGEIVRVARDDAAQPLDVPQLVAADGRLVLAWTDAREARVRSAEVRLP